MQRACELDCERGGLISTRLTSPWFMNSRPKRFTLNALHWIGNIPMHKHMQPAQNPRRIESKSHEHIRLYGAPRRCDTQHAPIIRNSALLSKRNHGQESRQRPIAACPITRIRQAWHQRFRPHAQAVLHSGTPVELVDRQASILIRATKKAAQRPLSEFWCRRRDLNPHTRYGHKHLKLACLPFHHSDELLPKSNDD